LNRREFAEITAAALAFPEIALAQPVRKPFRIVWPVVSPPSTALTAAFEQGLRDLGHIPGSDVVLEYHSADGKPERYPEVLRQVVDSGPDLIVTGTNAQTIAVRTATQTIPVVMALGTTVVETGLVKSLARPGGNITGLTVDVGSAFIAKRFELLKEAAPRVRRVAILYDDNYSADLQKADEAAAAALGLHLVRQDITDDFARTFSDLARAGIDAVVCYVGARQVRRRDELTSLAAKYRMPSSFRFEVFVIAGGFMSYGPSLADQYRRAAGYASKIMKGAKPADLPVEQPVKFDLVINLKTAKTLGLTVPQSVLLRADRVIE